MRNVIYILLFLRDFPQKNQGFTLLFSVDYCATFANWIINKFYKILKSLNQAK